MPRLPDVTDMGARPTPRSGRGIVRLNTGAEAKALQGVGSALERTGAKMMERIDKSQYAHARSHWLRESVKAANELDNDPDFTSYEAKYQSRMEKARSEAANIISDPMQKDLFEQDISLDFEKGLTQVQQKVKAKEGDVARANLAVTLEQNLDTLLRAKDPESRKALLDAGETAIDSLAVSGHISYEQAEKSKSTFEGTYALARFNGMTAEEQYSALKQEQSKGDTWLRSIPADKRMELMSSAHKQMKEAGERQVAQNKFDEIVLQNPDNYEEQVTKANTIKDAKIRDKVLSNIDELYARQKRIKEVAKETRNEKAVDVVLNGGKITDIPVKDYLDMEESDRKALEKLQRQRDGLEPADDMAALEKYDEVAQEYSRDPKSIMKYSLPELRANIPPDKIDKVLEWRQKASSGDASPDITQGQVTDVIQDSLAIMGIKTGASASPDTRKRAAIFRQKLEMDIQAFTENNGRKPSYTETVTMRDRLIEKISFSGWNSDKYQFELTPDTNLTKVKVPEDMRAKILQRVQEKNPDAALSEEQIKQIYIKMIQ